MPIQDYGRYMGNMAEAVQGPVNAFYQAQDDQKRNSILDLRAQQMQGELDDDAEWDAAYAKKDWDTLRRLDPETTQTLMAYEQQQQMSGLGDISVTAKPIDEAPIRKRYVEDRNFAADERDSQRNYSLNVAQESRMRAPPEESFSEFIDTQGNVHLMGNRGTIRPTKLKGETKNPPVQPGAASLGGVPGFKAMPAGTKLTEAQGKYYLGASMMAESIPTLTSAIEGGYIPTRQDLFAVGPPLKGAGNSLMQEITPREKANPKANEFFNAGGKILTAILRPESGGAITEDEWTMYGPMYLPWPGDSQEVVNKKMTSLNSYMKRLAQVSGEAAVHFSGVEAAPPGKNPEVAAALNPKEGQTGKSKSGKPIVFRGGKWEYQ